MHILPGWARAVWVAIPAIIIALAACSSSGSSGACTADATSCRSDGDCCSGNCVLQAGTAVCRDKTVRNPVCAQGGEACTQNRHCCDGLCENDRCFGSGASSVPSCQPNDGSCSRDDTCCSSSCGANGKCAAVGPAQRPDGGTCVSGGGGCVEPTDCCTGVCFPSPFGGSNICGSSTGGGGGGGGGSCVGSGRRCSSNYDCCSKSCGARADGSFCN